MTLYNNEPSSYPGQTPSPTYHLLSKRDVSSNDLGPPNINGCKLDGRRWSQAKVSNQKEMSGPMTWVHQILMDVN